MRRPHVCFWVTAVAGALLDQGTKELVFGLLRTEATQSSFFLKSQGAFFSPQVIIPSLLSLRCNTNEGGAFGCLSSHPAAFLVISVIAIAAIIWVFLHSRQPDTPQGLSLGLILAGAVGNLVDRVRFGHVRDFIRFHLGEAWEWPTFNLADAFICVGAGFLVLRCLKQDLREWKEKRKKSASGPS